MVMMKRVLVDITRCLRLTKRRARVSLCSRQHPEVDLRAGDFHAPRAYTLPVAGPRCCRRALAGPPCIVRVSECGCVNKLTSYRPVAARPRPKPHCLAVSPACLRGSPPTPRRDQGALLSPTVPPEERLSVVDRQLGAQTRSLARCCWTLITLPHAAAPLNSRSLTPLQHSSTVRPAVTWRDRLNFARRMNIESVCLPVSVVNSSLVVWRPVVVTDFIFIAETAGRQVHEPDCSRVFIQFNKQEQSLALTSTFMGKPVGIFLYLSAAPSNAWPILYAY